MPNQPNHDDLLRQARSGDRQALVKLLEGVGPEIRRRIEAKVPKHIATVLDADDIMQVTYLEAVMSLSKFAHGDAGAFAGWLGRLAENNLIDAVRGLEAAKRPDGRKRVGGHRRPDDSATSFIEMLGVGSLTPSRAAAKNEAGSILTRALSALPPDYAHVVRMYDLEGRSIGDVAKELGRSEGAVFMLRARAHDRLKDLLGPTGKFFSTPS